MARELREPSILVGQQRSPGELTFIAEDVACDAVIIGCGMLGAPGYSGNGITFSAIAVGILSPSGKSLDT